MTDANLNPAQRARGCRRFVPLLVTCLLFPVTNCCFSQEDEDVDPSDQRVLRRELTEEVMQGKAFKSSVQKAANKANQVGQEEGKTLPGATNKEASGITGDSRYDGLITGLTVFVLAVFVGFEVITKVPPTLHTPLMSGSNAISGITLVGAVTVTGVGISFAAVTGMFAVILATINVVGGFLVTHRMLAMFKKN